MAVEQIVMAVRAAASPPWWGVPVIAGGFLLLGGALTFLYTYLSDHRRLRIENNRVWEEQLIAAVSAMEAGARDYRKWVISTQRAEVELSIFGDERSAREQLGAAYDKWIDQRYGLAAVEVQMGVLTIMDAEPVAKRALKLQRALHDGGSLKATDNEELANWEAKVDKVRVGVLESARDVVIARRRALGLSTRKIDGLMVELGRQEETP